MKTSNQKEIVADKSLIAFCGLYCGACHSYLKGKCSGCKENLKATWCKTRQCCMESNFQSCADCKSVDPMQCKKFNTFVSRVFGFMLNSDRMACIDRIKKVGYDDFAAEMTKSKSQTIKRR